MLTYEPNPYPEREANPLSWERLKELSRQAAGFVVPNAVRMVGSIAGATGGGIIGAPAGPAGVIAGGALGSGAGYAASDPFAQSIEQYLGVRDKQRLSDTVVGSLAATLPAGPAMKSTASTLARVNARGAIASGVGASAEAATELANEGEIDPYRVLGAAAIGYGVGGIWGKVESNQAKQLNNWLATRQPRTSTGKTLDDVEAVFQRESKPLELDEIKAKIAKAGERARAGLISEFYPLKRLEGDVFKLKGKEAPTLDLARRFEQVAGAPGKAEADIIDFRRAVREKLDDPEDAKVFNLYSFLHRTHTRLRQPDVPQLDVKATGKPIAHPKQVGDFTFDDTIELLPQLIERYGKERVMKVAAIANGPYQDMMDQALRLQVQSGRMSNEQYAAIKAENDFYAPFAAVKYLEKLDSVKGTGKNIATLEDYTKAIKGIKQEDLKLGDMLRASEELIYKSRILAEKNLKMRELGALADIDTKGTMVRKIGPSEEPRDGFDVVRYLEDGKPVNLEVDKDVANAVTGLNAVQTGWASKILAGGMAPFKMGATGANLAFQAVNLFGADQPRLLLMSKYGLQSPDDVWRVPAEFAYSLFTSMKGNFGKPNELYMNWLRSGAARSTIQSHLTPDIFHPGLRYSDMPEAAKKAGLVARGIASIPNAIEETTKIMGLKRAMRLEGLDSMSPEMRTRKMEEIATELRNFAGSPDFQRKGNLTKQANLLFMFFNARLQGVASDFARLGGAHGGAKSAKAWARITAGVGIPAVAAWMFNQSEENIDDWKRVPKVEKENYFMLPRYGADGNPLYFTNDEGQKVREYYRIPKREIVKLFSNMTESALEFAVDAEPEGLRQFAISFLENAAPINIEGRDFQERIESVISSTNPLIKAPIEMGLARNTYYHRDTIPERLKGGATPGLQFTDTTPKLFIKAAEAFPDWVAEPMRSPLMLQQLTQGLTAGLVTQFMAGKPTEGRDAAANWPVFKRFYRSTYLDNRKEMDEIIGLKEASRDREILLRRDAEDLLESIPSQSIENVVPAMKGIYDTNRPLFDKLIDVAKEKQLGLTYVERQVKGLRVEDGSRARYVAGQLQNLKTDEEKLMYVIDMRRKGILTEEVLPSLVQILQEQKAAQNK